MWNHCDGIFSYCCSWWLNSCAQFSQLINGVRVLARRHTKMQSAKISIKLFSRVWRNAIPSIKCRENWNKTWILRHLVLVGHGILIRFHRIFFLSLCNVYCFLLPIHWLYTFGVWSSVVHSHWRRREAHRLYFVRSLYFSNWFTGCRSCFWCDFSLWALHT